MAVKMSDFQPPGVNMDESQKHLIVTRTRNKIMYNVIAENTEKSTLQR